MRRARSSAIAGIAASLAVLASLTLPAAGSDTPPSAGLGIAGSWQFDAKLSEDAQARLHDALEKHGAIDGTAPAPGSGGRSVGGRRGGRGGGGGSQAGGASVTAAADDSIATGDFLGAPERLDIRASATDVVFGNDAKSAVHYGTTTGWMRMEDGREVRAQWKGSSLVVEARWAAGTKLKTTYSLLPEAGRLEAVGRIELSSGIAATARRVYTSVTAGP